MGILRTLVESFIGGSLPVDDEDPPCPHGKKRRNCRKICVCGDVCGIHGVLAGQHCYMAGCSCNCFQDAH